MTSQDRWLPFIAGFIAVIGTANMVVGLWGIVDYRTTKEPDCHHSIEHRLSVFEQQQFSRWQEQERINRQQQHQLDQMPGARP